MDVAIGVSLVVVGDNSAGGEGVEVPFMVLWGE